jgi:hypothetical protein
MGGSPGYIFILSHMRSYSTLLAHLLGSHPEITGYAERGISYRSSMKLYGLRLRMTLSRELGRARYVLDKVLHDRYRISKRVLVRHDVVPIILVRRPEPTLASIFGLGALTGARGWYTDAEAVTRYYERRLTRLAEYGSWTRDRAIVVRSEDLMGSTPRVLARLTSHARAPITPRADLPPVRTHRETRLRRPFAANPGRTCHCAQARARRAGLHFEGTATTRSPRLRLLHQ